MRNADKSPKIPYSAVVSEVKNWSGIRIRDRITTESLVLPIGRSNHNTTFQWNHLITFADILDTEWHANWPDHIIFALMEATSRTVSSECQSRGPAWMLPVSHLSLTKLFASTHLSASHVDLHECCQSVTCHSPNYSLRLASTIWPMWSRLNQFRVSWGCVQPVLSTVISPQINSVSLWRAMSDRTFSTSV